MNQRKENSRVMLRILKRSYWSLILLVMVSLIVSSCIGPFETEVEEEPVLISIEGSLIKGNAFQTVVVTRSTSITNPQFVPVRGCDVSVVDEFETDFNYDEIENGSYYLQFPDDQMVVGRRYQLRVTTPGGERYESEYETLLAGVEIDSIYYQVEDRVDGITGEDYSGIQFYVDIEASELDSRFFRWKLNETYEFHSVGPISYFYYDQSQTPVFPADMWGVYQCWKTEDIEGEFISSTTNLVVNEKKNIPLHYVSNLTERLRIKYSLSIEQYSVDEGAYKYFLQNKIATEESGGLYTRQPRQPITNIQNVRDSTERVLGYFWLSSKHHRRLLIPQIQGLVVHENFCAIEPFNTEDHGDGPFPVYILEIDGTRYTGQPYCFDCSKRGGSTKRPTFWE